MGFSSISRPVTDLKKNKLPWKPSKEDENSFVRLKAARFCAPGMPLPSFERQFIFTTDASDVAVGGIFSKILNKACN